MINEENFVFLRAVYLCGASDPIIEFQAKISQRQKTRAMKLARRIRICCFLNPNSHHNASQRYRDRST